MPNRHYTDQPLSPELDAIAEAAADRLRAHCGDDPATADEHAHRVADAAGDAIRAGAALSAIAEAERISEDRARSELRIDILRKVEGAAKRKRETDTDYSEVCRADIEALRREPGGGHSLVVRGKGGKEVEVALNERTEQAVLRTVGARSQGPIFRRQDGRRVRARNPTPRMPFNRKALYRLLGELAESAGLIGDGDDQVDGVHPHRLRHTFVTTLLDMGVPLQAVQDAARHASPDTTRMYDRSRAAWREHPTHRLRFE